MDALDLLKTSDVELLHRADACLRTAGSALDTPPSQVDDAVRLRLFLEAHSYLTEILRRRADRAATQDRSREHHRFLTELFVIGGLIVVEILLSVLGLREGRQQAAILEQMKTSSAKTAEAIQHSTDLLKTLAEEQSASLRILQQQEADRLAQEAKKPKLVLYLEDRPLKAGIHFTPRKETETSATFDLDLTNNGDATATDVLFHVSVSSKDVFVDPPFTEVPLPPDQTMRTFQAPSNSPIRPRSHAREVITIHYPKGHAPFDIVFLAETNDQPAAPLGSLRVTPQKSPN